jgi:cell division protein FtsL
MALGTLIMIIMICVAAVIAIVGLVFLARSLFRLYKTVDGVQKQLDAETRVLLIKQDEAMRRVDSIMENQEQMQVSMTRLKLAVEKLSFLLGQYDEARTRLLNL